MWQASVSERNRDSKIYSDNPYSKPFIQPNYLKDVHDVKVLVDACVISAKMALSEPFKKFKPKQWYQRFCSPKCRLYWFRKQRKLAAEEATGLKKEIL